MNEPPIPVARVIGPVREPGKRRAQAYAWCVVCAVAWNGGKATPRHMARLRAQTLQHNRTMGHEPTT